MKLVKTANGQT